MLQIEITAIPSSERDQAVGLRSFESTRSAAASNLSSERGASMIEYAMLAMLIALVCVASISIIGNEASKPYSTVASSMALG